MKAWKTVALVGLVLVAAAVLTASVLGYTSRLQGTSIAYGPQGSGRGMMHSSMGGMMGYGYSQYGNYTSNDGSWQGYGNGPHGTGPGACGMGNRWP
jgi:hypothetical protein